MYICNHVTVGGLAHTKRAKEVVINMWFGNGSKRFHLFSITSGFMIISSINRVIFYGSRLR